MSDDAVLLVITTLPSEEAARDLAHVLIESRLAACVSRLPAVNSTYIWAGAIEEAKEIPLLIKTTSGVYPALEQAIRIAHPYELPEIMALPVATGLPAYLNWVSTSVGAPC
jgi:periplasmic divalent cation tolerance protein